MFIAITLLLLGEWLYKGATTGLTEVERQDIELQKQTVEIAKKVIDERRTKGSIEAYIMPESYDEDTERRLAVVRQQWREATSGDFQSEQTQFEKEQVTAILKPSVTQEKESLTGRKKYGLVDEIGGHIDFVCEDVMGEIKMDKFDEDEDADYNLSFAEREKRAMVSTF